MTLTAHVQQREKRVEQLEQRARSIDWSLPTIDLDAKVRDFVKSLRYVEQEMRRARLESFIRPEVDQVLLHWQGQVAPGSALLETAENEKAELQHDKERCEAEHAAARERIGEAETLIGARTEAKDTEYRRLGSVKPTTKYAFVSSWVFVVLTFAMGILTGYYYLDTQLSLHAAAQGIEIGQAAVAHGGFLTNWDYLRANPAEAIWVLGAIFFLLVGKAISVAYARIEHPRSMLLAFIAALVVLVGCTGWLIANVQDLQQRVGGFNKEIHLLTSPNPNDPGSEPLSCEIHPDDPRCAEKARLEAQLKPLTAELNSLNFWMRLAIIFGEITTTSVGFMLLSDHYERFGIAGDNIRAHITAIDEEIRQFKLRIEADRQVMLDASSARTMAGMLIDRLNNLVQHVPGQRRVQDFCAIRRAQQSQAALAILDEHNHEWALDDTRPRAPGAGQPPELKII